MPLSQEQAIELALKRPKLNNIKITRWNDIPNAEKFLIGGVSASLVIMAAASYPVGGVLLAYSALGYLWKKNKQDALVNSYYEILERSGGFIFKATESDMERVLERVMEISEEIGEELGGRANNSLLNARFLSLS